MSVINPEELLNNLLDEAMSKVGSGISIVSGLQDVEKDLLAKLIEYSEKSRGVLSVVITSITYKALHPEQDIRNHQVSIPNGYSGRGFDTKYITPFMKRQKFPYMAESGWLTRSLEQKVPYNKDFPGGMNPKLKPTFLEVIDRVQHGANCSEYLSFLFQALIIKRNSQILALSRPSALSISTILEVLINHFNGSYSSTGASRLPVLAIFAAYQCLINEVKRFNNKKLLPLESHTSADKRSGRIGDIDLTDEKNRAFEAVEVKHGIPITLQIVEDAFNKFQSTNVSRYYILSTANTTDDEWIKIQAEVQRIKNVHGCQLIVNGIMPTLKYYLRLLDDPSEFINNYVKLVEDDKALKFEHKLRWNVLIGEMV
ncbi:DNA (cytosine-5)-methyltransferase 1 [Pedobacter terrae]|uniref:DNA (Cytosine-5)-methyltransferase 1 n=1 Tax=Pedobacter terrae TaxID=405671 RepID=A0A1G7XG35_9SPHI|nr:hypothetical protein [Pedobacter terrae]SDG83041.1 DNA (cytosine-5)-methyltransferase 1 [Pedobacter terrae]